MSAKILTPSDVGHQIIQSAVGQIILIANKELLLSVACENDRMPFLCDRESLRIGRQNTIIQAAATQLKMYFDGKRKKFDLPIYAVGTTFQQLVWTELLKIPYGEVVSYGELAKRIGKPKASRAVASAIGRNPLPIIIPCQRVIGSTGELTGFASGLHIKRFLLELEGFKIKPGESLKRDKLIFSSEG